MKTISMLDFRQDSEKVIRSLRKGERLVLTYRGKPLARLEPVHLQRKEPASDPLFHVHEWARPSPLGPLNHDDIDKIVYENP
jgi:antitoxin (DNA-binding transcriptional repressor) of toxin-antitoxin stability system